MHYDPEPKRPRLPRPIEVIVCETCEAHGLQPAVVLALGYGRNQKERVICRAEIAVKLRREGLSYPIIGRYLRMHHSSVMHVCRRYAAHFPPPLPPPAWDPDKPDLSGEWNM